MPMVINKSVRIFALNEGMVPPGGSLEVPQEEFDSPHFQHILASGELVEERDQKKLQQAEQKVAKAEEQVGKAQGEVGKAQESVQQAHQKVAEQRLQQAEREQRK